MYPNPQDALPLPPEPNLDHHRKLAKDLVKACRLGDRAAIDDWATRWVDSLLARHAAATHLRKDIDAASAAADIAQFASTKLQSSVNGQPACRLSAAQFVIARAHGFLSWPRFEKHLTSLALASSNVSTFESAANAIVTGDLSTLARLLREYPALIRARSKRNGSKYTSRESTAGGGSEDFSEVDTRLRRG